MDSTTTTEATSKSPELLNEVYKSLQGVIAKINGINLGDKTILRIHFTNYFCNLCLLMPLLDSL